MGFFKNIWDGLLSFGACLLTIGVFAAPAWATYAAVTYGIVTPWIYLPTLGMVYVGANLAIAFLRKALDGVAPLRMRKRG
ncbi:hypothetical protein [uncultured Sulfitobacter sp.]|uniref:hypothetical protein n=1 Tax=uncultured Sulfitobacter sp. TaxID=191468 RepID=UPI0026200990|nr:hypothetical protein [uncultured Sulfitobacter sp.]